MVKDKTHSKYVLTLNDCKKRVSVIQKWIKDEKDLITVIMKTEKDGASFEHKRLKMLRDEVKFLNGRIRELKILAKNHQRATASLDFKGSKLQHRMYAMVLRQLNPMQKGIQALHAVVDYGEKMKSTFTDIQTKKVYDTWANVDKTMVVLDGGTSQELVDAICFLKEHNVPFKEFHEPDLYGCITAVCFIADERVWDTKKYPSYEQHMLEFNSKLNDAYTSLFDTEVKAVNDVYIVPPTREQWQAATFGTVDPEPFLELRNFIFSKKLSM